MNWHFPGEHDIAEAERRVLLQREVVRWQAALVTAHARRQLRSKTAIMLAGVAGFALPSLFRTGVGKRLLAAGSVLRWVSPVLRLLKA